MFKRIYLSLFLPVLIAFNSRSQDLTGIWRGHFHSNSAYQNVSGFDNRYRLEVQIAQRNNQFEGVTYSYLSNIFYGKASADGFFDPKNKKARLRELKLLEVRMSFGSDAIKMYYSLRYSRLGDEEFLEGTYISYNGDDSTKGERGVVFLHKVPESDFGEDSILVKREKEIAAEKKKIPSTAKTPLAPPAKKPTAMLNKPAIHPAIHAPLIKKDSSAHKPITALKGNPQKKHLEPIQPPEKAALTRTEIQKPAIAPGLGDTTQKIEKKPAPVLIVPKVLSNRQNELVKTITVSTNEVELRIYDDGAIDHDTVSVFVDKKNVINHAMLTDRAITVKLHFDEDNNYHEVVMVADNEGDIPPNTSLMVVKAGDKEYEVRIVSTEQKNAIVVFKFDKGAH